MTGRGNLGIVFERELGWVWQAIAIMSNRPLYYRPLTSPFNGTNSRKYSASRST